MEIINPIISNCFKLALKEYKTWLNWVVKVSHWELYEELKFDHMNKYYMCNPESVLENETHKLFWEFWDTNGSPNLSQTTRQNNNLLEKRTCRIVDFTVPVDHWVKVKETKKNDKCLDFARELKKLWGIKVTVIPIIMGALSTVTKGLIKWLEDLEIIGWEETLQTTVLLGSVRILRRVLETWAELLILKLFRECIG